MAVPKFDTLMMPLLQVTADGREHRLNDLVPLIADTLNLSEADRTEQMASGKARFRNRIYWARLYLSQAKAIEKVRPGVFRVAQRGLDLLSRDSNRVTIDDLMLYPEFREFREKSTPTHKVRLVDKDVTVTVPDNASEDDTDDQLGRSDVRESTLIHSLLADIGSRMGMEIWLPRGDRSAVLSEWKGVHPPPLERLPLNYNETTLGTIEQIDVLWLRGRSIRRAFEVEHTTAVYSGILRMADLLALQPNMQIKLHIVAPLSRRTKVFQELRRPVFALLERGPLSDCCSYLSYDAVRELAEHPHLVHLSDAVLDEYTDEAGDPNA